MTDDLQPIVDRIKQLPKYRGMDMLESTVRDIIERELPHYKKRKDAIKAARRKLHKVMAPYLGDPDYERAEADLIAAFAAADPTTIQAACADVLAIHDSTRERLEIIDEGFFEAIFAITGRPGSLLDVACGLNPLFFPWMGLESATIYAYDLHRQRVDFLNRYIHLQPGLTGAAFAQDVLLHPPQEVAEVGLLLKELRRLEDRQKGCGVPLIQAMQVPWVVVSLPAHNLTGRHDLREIHRTLFYNMVAGQPWAVTELEFKNELVFCIRKA